MKKTLLTILCTVLVCSCVMGATLALLMDETDTVKNTFTIGNVDIDLTETKGTAGTTEEGIINKTFKMIPGSTIDKDPTVTVMKDSEACWLFVKIDESENFSDFLSYEIAEGWTALAGVTGVYYREVASNAADQTFAVLNGNKVTVLDTVTKDQADALTNSKAYPTLSFTAYAVQKDNVADAAAAWAAINP